MNRNRHAEKLYGEYIREQTDKDMENEKALDSDDDLPPSKHDPDNHKRRKTTPKSKRKMIKKSRKRNRR